MKKQTLRTSDGCIQEVILVEGRDPQEPKKANSPISFEEQPGKDVRETVPLARSIVHVSLWTLVVLMPATLLVLGDIPPFLQMITGTVGAMFWLLVIIPDDRLIRLRDSPFLTGLFSCWKRESGQDEKLVVRTSLGISSFGQVTKQAATAASGSVSIHGSTTVESNWITADKGGPFAAWEQPELFSSELRAAFQSLR